MKFQNLNFFFPVICDRFGILNRKYLIIGHNNTIFHNYLPNKLIFEFEI